MILKLFIIPWIWVNAQNVPNNPTAVASAAAAAAAAQPPPPPAPNVQFVDIPFYQFLQRQNQINNAILLNNAMLANSLNPIPPNEHQLQIANTLQFPNAAATLHANHAALFPSLQPKFAAVPPTTGMNQLGIYDVLNRGVKFESMPNMLVPSQVSSSPTTQQPPIKPAAIHSEKEESSKDMIQEPDPIPIGISEPDEQTKKVIDLSVKSRQKSVQTTEIPPLTELIEEIGAENLITTTTEQEGDVTSTKMPGPDVYKLLKTLNLTDEETNDLVNHVEKVVREELVRKLSEARVIDRTKTPEKLSTTTTTTPTLTTEEATTVADSEEIAGPIKIPLRRVKPEKELLFYIPRKKPKAEIKHHPQRLSAEERPEFVEAEILTSQMHLPIQEKIEDDKIDEEVSEAINSFDADKSQEAFSTSTTTTLPITTTQAQSTSSIIPTIHQKILVREMNITVDSPKSNSQSYAGIDADLLNIGLATGAPLDLESEGNQVVSYRTRNSNRITTTTQTSPVFQHPVVSGRTKTTSHPKTPFERLAVDYKERLTGAGDMDKFLKTIYSNAYIALVDAKEASSVRIPLIMRRAQAGFG